MYESFFQLQKKPFRLTPDSRFYFAAKPHSRAMAYLSYAIQQGEGFLVLTGEPGTGKTTLIHTLKKNLSHRHCLVTTLNANTLDEQNFLQLLAHAMGVKTDHNNKASLLEALEKYLISLAPSHRHVVLFIDEAQHLSVESLEELRLLTNIQYNEQPLFQCFLIGQTGLKQQLQDRTLPQLLQRIVAACHLRPLDLEDTTAYVNHRLQRAGYHGNELFSQPALELIHSFSEGNPRRINRLCDRALLLASLEQQLTLNEDLLSRVIDELCEEMETPRSDITVGMGQQAFNFEQEIGITPRPEPLQPKTSLPENRVGNASKNVSVSELRNPLSAKSNTSPASPLVATNVEQLPASTTRPGRMSRAWNKITQHNFIQRHPRLLLSITAFFLISAIALPQVMKQNTTVVSNPSVDAKADLFDNMRKAALIDRQRLAQETQTKPTKTVTGQIKTANVDKTEATSRLQQSETPKIEQVAVSVDTAAKSEIISDTKTEITSPLKAAGNSTKTVDQKVVEEKSSKPKNNSHADKKTASTKITTNHPPKTIPHIVENKPKPGITSKTQAPMPTTSPAETTSIEKANTEISKPTVSENALQELLQRFSQAYRNGDVNELEQLLHNSVVSNDGNNLQSVSKEYAQLFQITQQRQLAFEHLQWQVSDKQARGTGQFQVAITEVGRSHRREFNGTIDVVVNTEQPQLKIAEIYYSYDN